MAPVSETDTAAAAPRQLLGEHQMQMSLLKALRDGVERGDPGADIDAILDQLADFSRIHFSSEQLLMRLYEYPDYVRHLDEHECALAKLDELRDRLKSGDAVGARACLETFGGWLIDHIHHTDAELARHLRDLEAR